MSPALTVDRPELECGASVERQWVGATTMTVLFSVIVGHRQML